MYSLLNSNKDLGGICMSKYNFEFKLQLVREKEEGFGREFLSNKYGVKYQIPEVS